MKIRKDVIENCDIDWFAMISGVPVHVSSNGGCLPDAVNDKEELSLIQFAVANLPDICDDNDVITNDVFIRTLIGRQMRIIEDVLPNDILDTQVDEEEYHALTMEERINLYTRFFKLIAKKGFVCFSRTNAVERKDNSYHLVAFPSHGKLADVSNIKLPHALYDGFDIFANEHNSDMLEGQLNDEESWVNRINFYEILENFELR